MILTLLPYAVEAGLAPSEFWDMTPAEILLITEHYSRVRERDLKLQLSANYDLAIIINNAFAGKLKGLYELYPDIFKAEAEVAMLARLKTTMLEYAAANNEKRRRAAEKSGGEE